MKKAFSLCAVALLLASACVTSFDQFETAYAPHDANRSQQVYPRLSGESCQWRLFGLIGIAGDNSLNSAVSKMTRGSAKIDNVLAVHVESKSAFYLFVSQNCTRISGYPVVYKDSAVKWQLFESNMMAGKLVKKPAVAGGTASVPTTPPARTPPPTTTTPPTRREEPVRRTEPPKPRETVPTQPQCEKMCGDFASLWNGSDVIRTTIRGQCVKKCLRPDNKQYRDCIKGASKMDDIARCNSL